MNSIKTNLQKQLHEIIRVNHAGETGAKVIYDGQILALKLKGDIEGLKIVEHMKEQEKIHLDYFDLEMKKRKVNPTLMSPVWKIGGFALGFITATINRKSAMTCTTAVEEVIDDHYLDQINSLKKEIDNLDEKDSKEINSLMTKIEQFRQEEIEHKNIAYDHNAKDFAGFKPMSCFIKATTKIAIAISKKI